ncbi:9821_t:CDS:2, partial [Dentiscutata erythropus]
SVDKEVPYFRSEEEFSPNAPRYAPLQIILDSLAIRSTQVVDTYLSSSACTTNNETFHKFADRSIFYNSLSAGLSSTVLNHASKTNLDTNDDAVRALIYLCIASDGVKNSMTETTKEFAKALMQKLISNIHDSTLAAINKR